MKKKSTTTSGQTGLSEILYLQNERFQAWREDITSNQKRQGREGGVICIAKTGRPQYEMDSYGSCPCSPEPATPELTRQIL